MTAGLNPRQRTCPQCERSYPIDVWRKRRYGRICHPCWKKNKWTKDPEFAERQRATSRRWKDGNRESNRARDRQHAQDSKVPCPACGTPRMPDSALCGGCRATVATVRQTLVEGMWADGWSMREINETLGIAPGSHYVTVMRAQHGWDLPLRYRMENGRRVAA